MITITLENTSANKISLNDLGGMRIESGETITATDTRTVEEINNSSDLSSQVSAGNISVTYTDNVEQIVSPDIVLQSPNNKKWKVMTDDSGVLSTEEIV
jgi:hypothetical protein